MSEKKTMQCPQCGRIWSPKPGEDKCHPCQLRQLIGPPKPTPSPDLKAQLLALFRDPEVSGAVDGWLKERLSVFSDNLAERIDSEQAHRGSRHRPKGSPCPLTIGHYLERFLFNAGKSFGEGVRVGKGAEQ